MRAAWMMAALAAGTAFAYVPTPTTLPSAEEARRIVASDAAIPDLAPRMPPLRSAASAHLDRSRRRLDQTQPKPIQPEYIYPTGYRVLIMEALEVERHLPPPPRTEFRFDPPPSAPSLASSPHRRERLPNVSSLLRMPETAVEYLLLDRTLTEDQRRQIDSAIRRFQQRERDALDRLKQRIGELERIVRGEADDETARRILREVERRRDEDRQRVRSTLMELRGVLSLRQWERLVKWIEARPWMPFHRIGGASSPPEP